MTRPNEPTGPAELQPVTTLQDELTYRRALLEALEIELAERELQLATLSAELSAFQVRYHRSLGARWARLDDLVGRIAAAWVRTRSGDDPEEEAEPAPTQAPGSGPDDAQAGGVPGDPSRFVPTESAKRLFRKLARRIHPDLAVDPVERERRTRLMVSANLAYEQGDTDALAKLLEEWEASPESVVGDGPASELTRIVRKISQVRARLEAITTELDALESSPRLVLYRQVCQADEKGWDLLGQMAEELDRLIAKAEEELCAVEGPPGAGPPPGGAQVDQGVLA